MSMAYTDTDLERACCTAFATASNVKPIAQLIADIRNETIERCAVEADRASGSAAKLVRALKDGGK